MSAYVVDPTHIDALLSVAVNGPAGTHAPHGWPGCWVGDLIEGEKRISPENASECGALLLGECIESVAYRYPDDDRDLLPGPIPNPIPEQYEWTDLGRVLDAYETLTAISGYEYQSCEHPGWNSSPARLFCDCLRSVVVTTLRGYREASGWHVNVEDAIDRARLAG